MTLSRLLKRLRRLKKLDAEAFEDAKSFFGRGRDVAWLHGRHWRRGVVVGFRGWDFAGLDFKVRTATGAEMWLSTATLLEGEGVESI